MELLVTPLEDHAIDDGSIEIVERKALGHSDTICDASAASNHSISPQKESSAKNNDHLWCRTPPGQVSARLLDARGTTLARNS